MSTTTTTIINSIDSTFPVAGKDNDSSGFRTNFNLIKTAMLAIDSTVSNLVTRIGALSATTVNVNAPLVTATHIIAKSDITVGGTNTITTGDNFSTVITANGQSGSIALLPASFTVVATNAKTVSPTSTTTNAFGVVDASKIVVGATFQYGPANTSGDNVGKTQTVASIDYANNIITAVNTASIPLFSAGDPIKFTNPFISGAVPAATQNDLASAISTSVPIGIISLWYGSVGTIPTGWALCNGQTVNGKITPDLRDRFVVGAGNTYSVSATGGTADAVVPYHNHTFTGDALPPHHHSYHNPVWIYGTSGSGGTGDNPNGITGDTSGGTPTGTISYAGTTGNATNANLPPYYALCYIMKTT